jgi:hypothetical protein
LQRHTKKNCLPDSGRSGIWLSNSVSMSNRLLIACSRSSKPGLNLSATPICTGARWRNPGSRRAAPVRGLPDGSPRISDTGVEHHSLSAHCAHAELDDRVLRHTRTPADGQRRVAAIVAHPRAEHERLAGIDLRHPGERTGHRHARIRVPGDAVHRVLHTLQLRQVHRISRSDAGCHIGNTPLITWRADGYRIGLIGHRPRTQSDRTRRACLRVRTKRHRIVAGGQRVRPHRGCRIGGRLRLETDRDRSVILRGGAEPDRRGVRVLCERLGTVGGRAIGHCRGRRTVDTGNRARASAHPCRGGVHTVGDAAAG